MSRRSRKFKNFADYTDQYKADADQEGRVTVIRLRETEVSLLLH